MKILSDLTNVAQEPQLHGNGVFSNGIRSPKMDIWLAGYPFLAGTGRATAAFVGSVRRLYPIQLPYRMNVTHLVTEVTTPAASGNLTLVAYDSNSSQRPYNRLAMVDVAANSTGYKEGAVSFTAEAHTLYWVGLLTPGDVTIRAAGGDAHAWENGAFARVIPTAFDAQLSGSDAIDVTNVSVPLVGFKGTAL